MITDYGTLKTSIANWLDRTDLTDKIPDFILLAENMIFRELRCPGNEQIAVYPASETGLYQPPVGGIGAKFANQIKIEIPNNYLEAKLVLYNDKPLTRVTDQRFTGQNAAAITGNVPAGVPVEFGRIKDNIYFFPRAATNEDVTLYYYETQGPLVNDNDWTRTLRYAPGLYLYGALLQAQAYLIGDERIPVWAAQFREIMDATNGQTDEDEVGGSTVTVRNIY
jgi:hypothetical protein